MSKLVLTAAAAALFASSALAGGPFYFSKIFVNPPGNDDGQEVIEIQGPANTSLAGYSFVVIEGDGSGAGTVDVVLSLASMSTGSNGICLIRDGAQVILPAPDSGTNVFISNFTPDLENGSNTYLLGNGTAPAANSDVDSDNDGTLNAGALTGFTVADAVALIENDGASNFAYADDVGGENFGPFNGPSPASHNSDAFYRIFNADGSPCAWTGGDVLGTNPNGPYDFDFAGDRVFGFAAEGITSLTLNFGSANVLPDTDGDGVANGCDGCPNDTAKTAPGLCGCGIPEGCSLGIDVDTVNATAGGTQNLFLYGGAPNAGLQYYLLGSVTGTTPGLPFTPSLILPLNYDFYTEFLLTNPNTIVANSNATLDGSGDSAAAFNLPGGIAALPFAVTIHHAYLVVNGNGKVVFVSNAAPLTLTP